jgi:O-antigen/teichoic acid export membrane protein
VQNVIHFGARVLLFNAARLVRFRADQILMAFLTAEAALGIYAVAVNASEVLLYLPAAIGAAMMPVIGGSEESGRAEKTLQAFRALLVITLGAVALAGALGPTLLPLIFGKLYNDAVAPFLWLLPGAIGFAAISVFSGALTAVVARGGPRSVRSSRWLSASALVSS